MPFWDTVMDSPSDIAYGKRLIPNVVDEIAAKDPDRICFSFPSSSPNRYHDVTFRTFANAINKTAHFIRREIGCSAMFETVMYLGHHDIRHFIVLAALMKTGHKVLFSSHGNSVAGHAELIKQSDCGILLYTSGLAVHLLLERCRMESVCMPELDYLLDDAAPCDHFPYEKTFDEARNHPCMLVHTSTTTTTNTLPKPIVWTHSSLASLDLAQLDPPFERRPTVWGTLLMQTPSRSFSALPISHDAAGLISAVARACFGRTAIVLGPTGLPNAADALAHVLDHADVDSAVCGPGMLEEAAARPEVLQKVGKLKYVAYTGGTLPHPTGTAISHLAPLYSLILSPEIGILTQYATDPSDWDYILFDAALNGIEMRPHPSSSNNNLHELVLVRKNPAHQTVFVNFPHRDEFHTGDLYERHPIKRGMWRYVGRVGQT